MFARLRNASRALKTAAGAIALALALTALPPHAHAETRITVFGASSMQDVLVDLARAYRTRHPETRIEFSFAGTQHLRTQIAHGAPADVFIAADTLHAAAMHDEGLIDAPVVFAKNRLALIARAGWIVPHQALDIAATLRGGLAGSPEAGERPGGVAGAIADPSDLGRVRTALQSLLRKGARVVLADSTVPAGRYARRALDLMSTDPVLGASFRARVAMNVVSHETNVRAVLAKVALGEADAGFVYETDVRAAPEKIGHLILPEPWNVNAEYAAAVVSASGSREAAASFVAFLSGDYARSILRRHGFTW